MHKIFKRKSTTQSTLGPTITNDSSPDDTSQPAPAPAPASSSQDDQFLKPASKQTFQNPPRILIIGAGSRGTSYAHSALTSTNAIVAAVAEPIAYKRAEFGKAFIWGVDGEAKVGQEFSDWRQWVKYEESRRARVRSGEKLGEEERGVDAVFVCVLDEMHEEVVCGVAGLGVHVCCEKPMATSLQSCMAMYRALKTQGGQVEANGLVGQEGAGETNGSVKRKDTVFGICHVLRYSPHNMMLRHLVLEKDVIGDVLSIEHVEPVGW
jgi:predicted dehydrogenase